MRGCGGERLEVADILEKVPLKTGDRSETRGGRKSAWGEMAFYFIVSAIGARSLMVSGEATLCEYLLTG